MQLGRVIGTVVATVKAPGLEGVKLLVIQPLDRHQQPVGSQVVAADAVHMAGPGELVYFVAAREAAQAMPDPFVPVDHAIVGIVDAVSPLTGDGTPPTRRQATMKLARVVATVVSTINAPDFDGRTLLVCDLLDPDGTPSGGYLIAVDSVGAGAGETVLLLDEGNSARQVLSAPGAPIRTVVVGIVDAVTGERAKPGADTDAVAAEAAAVASAEAAATPTPRPKAQRRRANRKEESA